MGHCQLADGMVSRNSIKHLMEIKVLQIFLSCDIFLI